MESVALIDIHPNLVKTLRHGLGLIGGFGSLNAPVIIKPNICTISDNTGYSVTHAVVIETLCKLLFEIDSTLSVRIVESDSQSKWANNAFKKFGYTDLVTQFQQDDYDVQLINLSESSQKTIDFKGEYFTDPELPEALLNQGYLISVAQAKTHYLTSITGVLKNLFGFLPRKQMSYYHPNINEVIVDLNRITPITLGIVDARIGVEGWNGPKTRSLGRFIFGHKPVSVDAVLAKMMGQEPKQIQHLVECQKYGLGSISPKILNDKECD